MRPAGDCHKALLLAAAALKIERAKSGQGATLLELVHRSQVGYKVARALVPKLTDRGYLQKVGERRVHYRNRPVAEYAPVAHGPIASDDGPVALAHAVRSWVE
jgi:hypothetical protein